MLVTFADRVIIVQCKSKKLTLEARRGNDLQLRNDFKKAVHDAYDQGLLCAEALQKETGVPMLSDGTKLKLQQFREIYILCVVSDHYPALSWQSREFLKPTSTEVIQLPLITDVFLIDVLADMLPSPLRFLSYLNRRVGYGERVTSSNELTILSWHLKKNLWIEDEISLVMIADDCAVELDAAMTVRREGLLGSDTVDGVWSKLQGTSVGRILAVIEHREDTALIDLGFMLLQLSGDTHKQLNSRIEQMSRQTRLDGNQHDFTLTFGRNAGITIHCSTAPNEVAADVLLEHCRRRKYLHHADAWFGIAVRADDGLLKFGVNLRFPWCQDDRLDRLTSGMQTVRKNTSGPDRQRKVGRNEPCPCRSGKKHKKCCLAACRSWFRILCRGGFGDTLGQGF